MYVSSCLPRHRIAALTVHTLATIVLCHTLSATPLPRIAIMPADNETSSSTLSDLVSVELSTKDSVNIIERSEIDRVLKEQDMSAAGLTDVKSRIALGKLLKADGFLFLEKSAKDDRISARLVETVQGFQVGYVFYPTEKTSAEALAKSISADTLNLIPKLSLDPSKRKLVSIIRIGNATLSSDYNWIEDEFPAALSAMLSVHPETIVLERRQLGRLFDEAKLTEAGQTDFAGGAYLLDGEVSITKNVPLEEGDTPLTFTVRIRNSNLRELARAEANGSINSLDELFARTASLTQERIAGLGKQETTSTETESKILHNMARKYNLLWAAEGAHALSPTNAETAKQVIVNMISEGLGYQGAKSARNARDSARILSRACSLCLSQSIPLGDVLDGQCRLDLKKFLASSYFLDQPDTAANLEIVRQALMHDEEARLHKGKIDLRQFVAAAPAFSESRLACAVFTKTLFDQALVRARTNTNTNEELVNAVIILQNSWWGPKAYVELSDHDLPDTIRYFVLLKLISYRQTEKAQQDLATQAADYLPHVLATPDFMATLSMPVKRGAYLIDTGFDEILKCCNANHDHYSELIKNCLLLILAKDNGLSRFYNIQGDSIVNEMAPKDAVKVIDKAVTLPSEGSRQYGPSILSSFKDKLRALRKDFVTRYDLASPSPENPPPKTMLSPEDKSWKSIVGSIYPTAKLTPKQESLLFAPQRLLLQTNLLYVAFGSGPRQTRQDKYTRTAGLMAIDMQSGIIRSFQFGDVDGERVTSYQVTPRIDGSSSMCVPMTPIIGYNDRLCFGQEHIGLIMFPRNCPADTHELQNVKIITTENGLLSRDVTHCATAANTIFVVSKLDSGSVLQECKPDLNQAVAILDTSSDLPIKDAYDSWSILKIFPSSDQLSLCMDAQLWEKQGQTGRGSRRVATCVWNPDTDQWHSLDVDPRKVMHDCFQKQMLEQETRKQLFLRGFPVDYDMIEYRGGLIAIVGYGKHWKLQFLPGENSPPDTIAWAETDPSHTAANPDDLIMAACSGDLPTIKRCLSAGADINVLDERLRSPLVHALASNRTECAAYLMEQGADIGIVTKNGHTPIIFAADKGNLPALKEQIKRGANVNHTSHNGLTPLHCAAYSGHLEAARFLIENGADVNARKSDGNHWTPIFSAASQGHVKIVKLLMEKGVDVNQRDKIGRTVLIESAFYPHPDVLEFLIENGADVNAKPYRGCSALIAAIMSGCPDNVRLLAEQGLDIHSPIAAQFGRTPLMHAAWKSTPEVVQCLLDLGAKVDAENDSGKTALFFAALGNKTENITVLLSAGADPTKKEKEHNFTAIDLTRKAEPKAVLMEALEKKEAAKNQE